MKPTFQSSLLAAAMAGVTAAVINSLLYFLFHATGAIPDTVFVQDGQPITVLPVILSSVIPSLLAGVVFYLLNRYTKNGYRIFSVLAIILLVLSFANPFLAIQGIPLKMALALNGMHLVVVAMLLYFFRRIRTTAPSLPHR